MELIATRGLQASGKSTWAMDWVREDPENRVRVERDCLRDMFTGGFVKENEYALTKASHAMIESLLCSGKSVVVSDTNLRSKTLRELRALARKNGAEFRVKDFTDVLLATCIDRDRGRDPYLGERPVGEDVIRNTYQKYLANKSLPLPLPPEEDEGSSRWEPYVDDPALPTAIMVDIDGTLARMTGRSPYDWTRVIEDVPHGDVSEFLEMIRDLQPDVRIILVSGRLESVARKDTEAWLRHYEIPYDELYMRTERDTKDYIVKHDLFNKHIRDRYRIWFVLDDRDRVVQMWREMGLDCWQVRPGNF